MAAITKLPEFNPNELGFEIHMNLGEANFTAYNMDENPEIHYS